LFTGALTDTYSTTVLYRRHSLGGLTVLVFILLLLAPLDFLLEDFEEVLGELVVADHRDNRRLKSFVHLLLFGDLTIARVQALGPHYQLQPTTHTWQLHSDLTIRQKKNRGCGLVQYRN